MITFETQVVNLVLGEATLSWQVTTDDLRSGSKATLIYDAVIVASGHYQIPFIPPYQGIVDFNEKYSGVITHSKNFDSPEHFRNKVRIPESTCLHDHQDKTSSSKSIDSPCNRIWTVWHRHRDADCLDLQTASPHFHTLWNTIIPTNERATSSSHHKILF